MNTTNLPLWFLQWWDFYGCHVDYLKEHPLVENGYLHFKNNFQPAPSKRKFSSLLIFCTKFFVPWDVHGSMIIIYKTDIQYLFASSKSSGGIPLQLSPKVQN